MKKIFTVIAGACALFSTANAQFTENFSNDITSLSGNCWQFANGMAWTNSSPNINGGTIYGTTSGDVTTPYINVTSTSVTISFNYQLSGSLNGSSSRTIEIGLYDFLGNYSTLQIISLNNSSPTTVQTFNNTYTLGSTGLKKLEVSIGGSGGSVKLMIDDLSTSASLKYGPVSHCNNAPVLARDTFFFFSGMTGFGNVMLNDVEPDGENMTADVLTPSPDGTITMNANGSFSFTPNPGFTGTSANFVYKVCDDGYPSTCAVTTVKLYFVEAAPLPVKLTTFQGNKNGDKVSLQWTVATNEIVDRFEVERSTNGRDYNTAALVFSSEKFGEENYSFKETQSADVVYYRLKMYDKNHVAEYSKILVFRSTSSTGNVIRIINNPVKDKLTLSFSSSLNQAVNMKIYDVSGAILMSQKLTVYEGSNLISLPLSSSFKPGFYVVEINNGGEYQTAKFVKQ